MRSLAVLASALALVLAACESADTAAPDATAPGATTADAGGTDGMSADADHDPIDAAAVDAVVPRPDAAPLDPSVPTWHRDIRPIFDRACNDCHRAGGIGPFDFTAEFGIGTSAPPWASIAVASVGAGLMPPWPPDPDCRTYQNSRALDPADREAILAWGAAGHPLGDPADAPPPVEVEPEEIPPADLVLTAEGPYVPDAEGIDDYRCLPLVHTFEEDTWVTRIRVRPDRAEMVHHVVTFLIPPDGSATVDRHDRVTDEPGYRCFGDPRVYPTTVFSAWAPGGADFVAPEGSAMQVAAGSRLVMQMHYNLAAAGSPPPADQTALELWTLPAATPPAHRIDVVGFADVWLDVPEGASAHESEQVFHFAADGDIIAIAPHMHLLGRRIRVDIEPAEGEAQCLVDIPRWDFDWQDGYRLADDAPISVRAGDALRLRCTYDNSAAAQPFIDGEQQAPRRVGWGDGTYDEMCLAFAFVRRPVDEPYNACAGAAECTLGCEPGDADCLWRCFADGGIDCLMCAGNEWVECALEDCNVEALRFVGCLNSTRPCGGGACAVDTCLAESDAIFACSHERLTTGGCNGRLRRCGLRFPRP